jgi:ribonuclease HII
VTADRPVPDLLAWERQLWEGGYLAIAGVDEVGRGALAGPLVAAAVILPTTHAGANWANVRDSKTLTHRRREQLAGWILESGAQVAIAEVHQDELDAIGVAAANRCAMERAVAGLPSEPDMLLIDAMTLDLDTPQIGVIDGDAQCLSIAAASIVAKVHRDALMIVHHNLYPEYGFARHKGYGVAAHLQALTVHGPCPLHRRSFAPVRAAAHGDD